NLLNFLDDLRLDRAEDAVHDLSGQAGVQRPDQRDVKDDDETEDHRAPGLLSGIEAVHGSASEVPNHWVPISPVAGTLRRRAAVRRWATLKTICRAIPGCTAWGACRTLPGHTAERRVPSSPRDR